jgi:hypothetical protein
VVALGAGPGRGARKTKRICTPLSLLLHPRKDRSKEIGQKQGSSITFALQRTYLVFASDAGGGVYRQITKAPTHTPHEGVILAGDEKPHRGKTVTEVVWAELVALLASPLSDDALTAIRELDARSGGHRSSLADFARKPVLDLLRPSIPAGAGPVQDAVIGVFGALSPYTEDDEAPYFDMVDKAPASFVSP